MHWVFHLRNFILAAVVAAVVPNQEASGGIYSSQPPDKEGLSSLSPSVNGDSDEFVTQDNGPSSLQLEINSKTKSVQSVAVIADSESTRHLIDQDGNEVVLFERDRNGSVEHYEFDVNRASGSLMLRRAENAPAQIIKPASMGSETATNCPPRSSISVAESTGFAVDLKLLSQSFEERASVSSCGDDREKINVALANLISKESRSHNLYVACIASRPKYKELGSSLTSFLESPRRNLIICNREKETRVLSSTISLGSEIRTQSSKLLTESIFAASLKVSADLRPLNETQSSALVSCCSGSENSRTSCQLLDEIDDLSEVAATSAWFAIETAKKRNLSSKKINELLKRIKKLDKAMSASAHKDRVAKFNALCVSEFGKSCDPGEIVGVTLSAGNGRAEAARTAASSNTISKQRGSSQTSGSVMPSLGQKIRYQKNDPASVKSELNKYQYMGPLTTAVRKAADSISAQLDSVAYASSSQSASRAGDQKNSYISEAVSFDSNRGSTLKFDVNGKSVYVKSKIPFSDTTFGEPSTEAGSTATSMASVKMAKAATTSSSAVNVISNSSPTDSGPALASSARAGRDPSRISKDEVANSSQTVSNYSSLKEFNQALVSAKDPQVFLSNAKEDLQSFRIQVVLKGVAYPKSPTYTPTRVFDYDEMKRLMRR